MASKSNPALEALKAELEFVEKGGYRRMLENSWGPALVFEDSPICVNRTRSEPRLPCSECVLAFFVPEEHRERSVPCRYIPLNPQGETLDDLYRTGSYEEMERAVGEWLKTVIARMEAELENIARDQEKTSKPKQLPGLGKSNAPLA